MSQTFNSLSLESSSAPPARSKYAALNLFDLPDSHDYFVIDSDQQITDALLMGEPLNQHRHWFTVNPRLQYLTHLLTEFTAKFAAMEAHEEASCTKI